MQAAARKQDFSPLADGNSPAELAMSDSGLMALAKLCGVAEQRLQDAGWELEDDPARPGSGNVQYTPLAGGLTVKENPLLKDSWLAADPEGRWPAVLLQVPAPCGFQPWLHFMWQILTTATVGSPPLCCSTSRS